MDVLSIHPHGLDMVGLIPMFLDEDDPRPAREQLNENYAHGGGWRPIKGFTLNKDVGMGIQYPGDPVLMPVAVMRLRTEEIWVYRHSIVLIFDAATGKYEVARMD